MKNVVQQIILNSEKILQRFETVLVCFFVWETGQNVQFVNLYW